MADYLKLFLDKRLTTSEPFHLEFIKGKLANMRIEDPSGYENYSKHYGVEVDAQVTKMPKTITASKTDKKVTMTSKVSMKAKKTK